MRLLLDTVAFLWITLDDPRLSRTARQAFGDPANQVYLSVVSSWEIALKHSAGKLPLPEPLAWFIVAQRRIHGIQVLPLDEESALYVGQLPKLHRDPFDRMLVSQAIVHGLAVLTPDERIGQYAVRTIW